MLNTVVFWAIFKNSYSIEEKKLLSAPIFHDIMAQEYRNKWSTHKKKKFHISDFAELRLKYDFQRPVNDWNAQFSDYLATFNCRFSRFSITIQLSYIFQKW